MNEQTKLEFINKVASLVQKYDSPISASIRIAQACHETGFGTSELANKANNLFGIKASAPWSGAKYPVYSPEWQNGVKTMVKSEFRKYGSWEESIKDNSTFYTSTAHRKKVYSDAINGKTYKDEAYGLTGPGRYATDPNYAKYLISVVEKYNLTKYNKKTESGDMSKFKKPAMVDRRKQALGYPGHGVYPMRSLGAIKQIVRHFTATKHEGDGAGIIKRHEDYWRGTHKWDIGGYHFYIDRQGKIFWNYDLTKVTYGAGKLNPSLVHFSMEASSVSNYTNAQKVSEKALILWLMEYLNISANNVKGHKEIPYNSTSCPGYSIAQLSAYRKELERNFAAGTGGTTTTKPTITPSKSSTYTVKHGDTLWAIGQAHGVAWQDIKKWSNLETNMLSTGQVLRVKPPVSTTQRTIGGTATYKRTEPNTKGKVITLVSPKTVFNIEGYVLGERVEGLNAWYKVKGEEAYIWSGGTTTPVLDGLKNLTNDKKDEEDEEVVVETNNEFKVDLEDVIIYDKPTKEGKRVGIARKNTTTIKFDEVYLKDGSAWIGYLNGRGERWYVIIAPFDDKTNKLGKLKGTLTHEL